MEEMPAELRTQLKAHSSSKDSYLVGCVCVCVGVSVRERGRERI